VTARTPGSLVAAPGAGAGAWTTVTVPVPGELVVDEVVVVVGGLAVVVGGLVVLAGVILTPTAGLVEPCRLDPGAGTKTAVSLLVDVVNDVSQNTVTVWPVGLIGMLAQPPTGFPRFAKVSAPSGAGAPALELTVAIKVTVWSA
jgi:hypothetical protein